MIFAPAVLTLPLLRSSEHGARGRLPPPPPPVRVARSVIVPESIGEMMRARSLARVLPINVLGCRGFLCHRVADHAHGLSQIEGRRLREQRCPGHRERPIQRAGHHLAHRTA